VREEIDMTLTQGFCAAGFEPVRDALEQQLATGEELGASVCVTLDGQPVVDVWGGYADADRTTPWAEDTIVNVFSLTKTMTALSALLLVDRGELDVYQKVAHYWPEFAANGKADIEVRHLLSHTSGVSGWERPIELEDIYDTEAASARLATQAPWWEPGTASGYQALNYGHLVGEVIRRVDGRSLGRFFAEELAGPLGADFHIGTGPEHFGRIAPMIPAPAINFDMSTLDQDSILVKSVTCPWLDLEKVNTAEWRQTELGAMNGHGNARSVARVMSVLALGGTSGSTGGGTGQGVRLLSPATIEHVFREQAHGTDLFLGVPMRFGIGYGLPEPTGVPFVPEGRICFWGGWGGSMIIMDLDRRTTISYMMNKMQPGLVGSDNAARYLTTIYKLLG
jgi:CubicO group peptidase (beta-lactamase class C family)